MRSPISSVGNIELDGILKGSTIKERTMNTASRTGKKPAEYSSQTGRRKASSCVCASAWPAARRRRRGRKNSLSAHHTLPVTSTRMEKISVKFIFLPFRAFRTAALAALRLLAVLVCTVCVGASCQRGCTKRLSLFIFNLQNRQKSILRNLHAAHLLHPFFTGLLFFQQFLFARDIAAVAFGEHILAQCLDVFARNDLCADRGLNRHIVHLTRNQLAHSGR